MEMYQAGVSVRRVEDITECPRCGNREHCYLVNRDFFQCSACHKQTSPIAATIFASTKLPLTVWFRALYLLTQSTQDISSSELGRRLGVSQTTASKIKNKLGMVMRPDGSVEIGKPFKDLLSW